VSRTATIERLTAETKVTVELDLDGTGVGEISTGVGFYDHMLNQIAKHGGFDLRVSTVGDLEVVRFGSAVVPLDEVLVQAAVDLSGRPYVVHDEPLDLAHTIGPVYPTSMTRHVWESFGHAARVTLHVSVLRAARQGSRPDAHHVVEAQFKAVARALRQAVALDPRNAGVVPSTKGSL
jgi:imidazoleglycerol-phosphate dehydratase